MLFSLTRVRRADRLRRRTYASASLHGAAVINTSAACLEADNSVPAAHAPIVRSRLN